MKTKEFATFLAEYAQLQRSLGAEKAAMRSLELSRTFENAPTATVDQTLNSASLWITQEACIGGSESVDAFTQSYVILQQVLARTSTASKLKPLNTLLKFLSDHGDMKWATLIDQLNQSFGASDDDVVRFYVSKLNSDYKDKKRFARTFEALKKDKRIKVKLALEISSQFTSQKMSGTKAKALDWIWKKHQYYVTGLAASKAMAGKSAA